MVLNIKECTYIEGPPRSNLTGAILVLSVITLLSLVFVIPNAAGMMIYAVLAGILALSIIIKAKYAIHTTLFVFLWLLLVNLIPQLQIWPLSLFVPLVVYGLGVSTITPLRQSIGWIHWGRIDQQVARSMIVTVLLASASLIAWALLTKPDLKHHLALIPDLPFWVYPIAGIGFGIFNALMEEIIFRGILMETLDSALGARHLSMTIQAVPFAALHYLAGFPNGPLGAAMVFVYGVMLGYTRRQSKGMLAPLLTHIIADLTIFAILTATIFG